MKKTNNEAKLAVAQVYWNRCRLFKEAESMKDRTRDLALVALRKGETIGPVSDVVDGTDHWLTHGEKERVEMDALALHQKANLFTWQLLNCLTVNTTRLKELYPKVYYKMLKEPTTKCTKHSCLTWSEKIPATRRMKKKPVAKRKATRS